MAELVAPTRLVRPRQLAFVPEDVRRLIDSYNPRTYFGGRLKHALAHLPRDLALELLDAIQSIVVVESSLAVARIHGARDGQGTPGTVDDFGIVSRKVVTDAGVAYLVDDFDNGAGSADVSLFNFHGIGTGSVAEAVTDTALGAESTTALNPDSTRATGTRSQPAANQYRSVGTLTADAQILAREHGLFTTSGTGTGTLWDRSVYALVTLEASDSLQATYTLTCSAGG